MAKLDWRQRPFEEAIAGPDLRDRAARALAAGPLCDPCLGRLVAGVGTGLRNADRGRMIRRTAGLPPSPAGSCTVCHGFLGTLDTWIPRIREALAPWEFDTFAVASRADPAIRSREQALWDRAGGDLAEPYKQEVNRELGVRLADALGKEPDLVRPDVVVLADHASGEVSVLPQALFVCGRYRKLVRGLPQCRWAGYATSVQDIIGGPVCRAAQGTDHEFHGAGREDVDVRCLGERPFVLEVLCPRRRRLDWTALAAEINASHEVEVLDLARCDRNAPARVKGLRPEKTYRALVRLGAPVADEALGRLTALAGPIRQQTPRRVLKRRANRARLRHVRSVEWRTAGPQTFELVLRTSGGLYIKELVSGDGGRTRPSVAELLGTAAECAELDVVCIHID